MYKISKNALKKQCSEDFVYKSYWIDTSCHFPSLSGRTTIKDLVQEFIKETKYESIN